MTLNEFNRLQHEHCWYLSKEANRIRNDKTGVTDDRRILYTLFGIAILLFLILSFY